EARLLSVDGPTGRTGRRAQAYRSARKWGGTATGARPSAIGSDARRLDRPIRDAATVRGPPDQDAGGRDGHVAAAAQAVPVSSGEPILQDRTSGGPRPAGRGWQPHVGKPAARLSRAGDAMGRARGFDPDELRAGHT